MTTQWPALVVLSGPLAGRCFTVRPGPSTLGRGAEADFRLERDGVSRQHLSLDLRDGELVVQDLGSVNGTYLNGVRVHGSGLVRPGDTLRVGDVELQHIVLGARTIPAPAPRSSSSSSYDFGVVHGPVSTGDPVNHDGYQVVGSGSIYHGEVRQGDRYTVGQDNPLSELFAGRGAGRALVAVGLVSAVVGFGIWVSVIFSFMGSDAGPDASPFSTTVLGLSAPVTGFALFAVGGLLMAVGASMSRAAREREERWHR